MRWLALIVSFGVTTACVAMDPGDQSVTSTVGPGTTSSSAAATSSTVGVSTTTVPSGELDSCPFVEPGIGDSVFPGLGNVGYDVDMYDIALEFSIPDDVEEHPTFSGSTTVTATATSSLDAFNLDAAGLEVAVVRVDGEPAEWCAGETELTVVPASVVDAGSSFDVTVEYSGVGRSISDADDAAPKADHAPQTGFATITPGIFRSWTGLFASNQPNGASTWFPCSDHPTDRARFRLAVTVPAGKQAVSAGDLVDVYEGAAVSTYVWETREPMAPYMLPLAIGVFEKAEREGPDGMTLHLYFEEAASDGTRGAFSQMRRIIEFFSKHFGPYPFDRAGAIVVDYPVEPWWAAFETQTMPTLSDGMVYGYWEGGSTAIIAHEVAHQWFGNWVAVADWGDIWLNESFAYWAERFWLEQLKGSALADANVALTYEAMVREEQGRRTPPAIISGPDDLFGAPLYDEFTLIALRDHVGDDVFFDILRTWVERYGGGNATTADFLALVDEIAGPGARELVELWLYSTSLPPLPARGLEAVPSD